MRCERTGPQYLVRFSNGTFEAVCDAGPDKGGRGQGFRPHELLEAALGSCTAMIIGMSAAAHGIPLTGVAVTVSLDREDPAVAAFVCEIELSGDLDEGQRTRLLRAARGCPVRKTLARRSEFREKAKPGGATAP
jgi:putative redox protein